MGYTHIELLPISEHPLDQSWGYQPIGLFAPTRRFGEPAGFARFVDRAHAAGLGVILDWVPAHFPTDQQGLARFDGTALYEHADPRKGFQPDWNTAIYNFGRTEVANFLYCNALYWVGPLPHRRTARRCSRFDALPRLFAQSRRMAAKPRRKAKKTAKQSPSCAAPMSSSMGLSGSGHHCRGVDRLSRRFPADRPRRPRIRLQVEHGVDARHSGLRVGIRSIAAGYNEDDLRSPLCLQREFRAADSHDEVVDGKGSVVGKMPGDECAGSPMREPSTGSCGATRQKTYSWARSSGRQPNGTLTSRSPWWLLQHWPHQGVQASIPDLNRLYRETPALYVRDCEPEGFRWIVVNDEASRCWPSFAKARKTIRRSRSSAISPLSRALVIASGFPMRVSGERRSTATPAPYGGSNMGNSGGVTAETRPRRLSRLGDVDIASAGSIISRFQPAPGRRRQPDYGVRHA